MDIRKEWNENMSEACRWAEERDMQFIMIRWRYPQKWQGRVEDTEFFMQENKGKYRLHIINGTDNTYIDGTIQDVGSTPLSVVKWIHMKLRQAREDCCYTRGCDCYENE